MTKITDRQVARARYDTSIGLLAPRGCLVNYGQLSGNLPPLDFAQLMEAGSIFVTKDGPRAGVVAVDELAPIIASTLLRAEAQPLSAGIAARFPLDSVVQAFRTMEAGAPGKVLVIPGSPSEGGGPACSVFQ